MSNPSEITAPADPGSKELAETFERALLDKEQMPIKYVHTFAPGVYVREAHVKAGMVGIGHEHKLECVNVLLKGSLRLVADDKIIELSAPCVFTSVAGSRKVAHFIEDTIFLNVLPNPTNETDLKKIEDLFVIKSDTFLEHEAKQLQGKEAQAIAESKL